MSRNAVLITGATRGLGRAMSLALARLGHTVIASGRSFEKLARLKHDAEQQGLVLSTLKMDVGNDGSVDQAAKQLQQLRVCLDCLVNNAGVILESGLHFDKLPVCTIQNTMNINAFGSVRTIHAFAPLLEKSANPRIVNVSSGMAVLRDMASGHTAYRMSKAALNVVSVQAHYSLYQNKGIRVLTVCPGWVKTDMGGQKAERDVAQGIAGIIWAINTPVNGPSGGFYRDGKPISW